MKRFMSVVCIFLSSTSFIAVAQTTDTDGNKDCGPKEHHRNHMNQKGGEDEGMDNVHGKMFEFLQLTDVQKQFLADARVKAKSEHKALQEKIRSAHEALRSADEAQADEATLKKLASTVSDLMTQQELTRMKERRAFIAQLTPEQKKSLVQWQKDHPSPERFQRPEHFEPAKP